MSGNVCIDLTDKPDSYLLPDRPLVGYLIWSFEIVLADSTDTYLLLQYGSYAVRNGSPADCIWAPPFAAEDVPLTSLTSRRLGALRQCFGRFEASITDERVAAHTLYLIGATGAEWRPVGDIFEYKESFRDAGHRKLYKVRRYSVVLDDDLALLNAADPEGLKGHVFLPLTQSARVLVRPFGDDTHIALFRGKPLVSHLARLLADPDQVEGLVARATRIPRQWCVLDESGVLLRVDVAGYGRLCEYVRANMRSFQEDGQAIERWLNNSLYKTFVNELGACGAARVRLEGDGFVAAFPTPLEDSSGVSRRIGMIVALVGRIGSAVRSLNTSIIDTSRHVYCRAAICLGSYRFGRIGELASDGGELEGSAITEVSRLEQVLKDHLVQAARAGSGSLAVQGMPDLAMPVDVFEKYCHSEGEIGGVTAVTEIARKRLVVKEFAAEISLCSTAMAAR
jgi:class 3 adenylate cyclase